MTGSVMLLRQQSSTVGNPTTKTDRPPKLRRCSSADDTTSTDVILDDRHSKGKSNFIPMRDSTFSESDSGTEDVDQQMVQFVKSETTTDNVDDDERASFSTTFGPANDDEGFSEQEIMAEFQEVELKAKIEYDLSLARNILDETKKDFCENTTIAFHGEFARLIQAPGALQHPFLRLFLIPEEALPYLYVPLPPSAFLCRKVDNAKAQFKCPNVQCQHAWTSMRARISFLITTVEFGFVFLKVYGQACKMCKTHSDPLWYIDEVCRVMKNLRSTFQEMNWLNDVDVDEQQQQQQQPVMQFDGNYFPRSRHDPTQRRGKMHAMHDRDNCEACLHGVCFC